MGEYALYQGETVKIGTCEEMFGLRAEDVFKITPLEGSVDPRNQTGLFFRLPFPDEDDVAPGKYEKMKRGFRLGKQTPQGFWGYNPPELRTLKPGRISMGHESGLRVSVPCRHGYDLPASTDEVRFFWNGKATWLELASVKRRKDGIVVPVIRCTGCGDMWSFGPDNWPEILAQVWDETLRERLSQWSNPALEALA